MSSITNRLLRTCKLIEFQRESNGKEEELVCDCYEECNGEIVIV